jgi:hypothetical protein
MHQLKKVLVFTVLIFSLATTLAASKTKNTRILAFYTAKNDQAHISFVNEANNWFAQNGAKNNFIYRATNDWNRLNPDTLANYQIVFFLDTRPEAPAQRKAFQDYMENGGAFIGFHFSAFALTPSTYPQDWDWYHENFLGSGEYKSNTWRPTSAILKVEDRKHPATARLPKTFKSQPNEWYAWKNNLRNNPNIEVLLSVDPSSYPLGTGPKPHEIWHSGDYPVVWTNKNYRMIYINMGNNDIDYEHGSNKELSYTFTNQTQNQLILDAIKWLLEK